MKELYCSEHFAALFCRFAASNVRITLPELLAASIEILNRCVVLFFSVLKYLLSLQLFLTKSFLTKDKIYLTMASRLTTNTSQTSLCVS